MRFVGQSMGAPRRGRNIVIVTIALLLLIIDPHAAAAEPPLSDGPWTRSELHVKVLMSAPTSARPLQHTDADALRIGVLFDPSNADSLVASTAVITALEHQAKEMTFRDRPIIVSGLPLSDTPRMRKAMQTRLHVLYLVNGLSRTKLRRVTRLTRELKIISITGIEAYVQRGATLAAVVRKGRPHILIHLGAAKAEGAEFSSQLLQLAEIVGRPEDGDE